MKNPLQYWVSRIRLRGASVALAFVVVLGLRVVVAQSAPTRTFKVLYTFQGSSDGGEPYAGLVRDSAGNLYGTAISSGAFGWGVVFKVNPSGTETVLHSFGDGSKDGRTPYGGLVRDKAGNLYGTTYEGGGIGCVDGCGTVFKVDTTGTETVLHSFAGGTTDGCFPYAGLLLKAGYLYGTHLGLRRFQLWNGVPVEHERQRDNPAQLRGRNCGRGQSLVRKFAHGHQGCSLRRCPVRRHFQSRSGVQAEPEPGVEGAVQLCWGDDGRVQSRWNPGDGYAGQSLWYGGCVRFL